VEFFINGNLLGSDNTNPYALNWTSQEGTFKITAKAYDNFGFSSIVSDTITIIVTDPEPEAPEISIISPANGASYEPGENVNISVNATDSDGQVVSVKILLNSAELVVLNTPPYNTSWTSVNGLYTITAIAEDNDALVSQDAIEITVGTVSIGETFEYTCHVYPNPVKDVLVIDINTFAISESAEYIIHDLNGKIIIQGQFISGSESDNSHNLNVSSFKSGLYILTVKIGNNCINKLIVKE
jgi:hypothetical protein